MSVSFGGFNENTATFKVTENDKKDKGYNPCKDPNQNRVCLAIIDCFLDKRDFFYFGEDLRSRAHTHSFCRKTAFALKYFCDNILI